VKREWLSLWPAGATRARRYEGTDDAAVDATDVVALEKRLGHFAVEQPLATRLK